MDFRNSPDGQTVMVLFSREEANLLRGDLQSLGTNFLSADRRLRLNRLIVGLNAPQSDRERAVACLLDAACEIEKVAGSDLEKAGEELRYLARLLRRGLDQSARSMASMMEGWVRELIPSEASPFLGLISNS